MLLLPTQAIRVNQMAAAAAACICRGSKNFSLRALFVSVSLSLARWCSRGDQLNWEQLLLLLLPPGSKQVALLRGEITNVCVCALGLRAEEAT